MFFISHFTAFVICCPANNSSAGFRQFLSLNLKNFFINLPHTPKTLFNTLLLLCGVESGKMFCFNHLFASITFFLCMYLSQRRNSICFCSNLQNYQSQQSFLCLVILKEAVEEQNLL